MTVLANFQGVVWGIGILGVDLPGKSSSGGSSGQSFDRSKVGRGTLAEYEGGRGVVLGRVGDGVGLTSLDRAGPGVELNGQGRSDKGSARDNKVKEAHVGGCDRSG